MRKKTIVTRGTAVAEIRAQPVGRPLAPCLVGQGVVRPPLTTPGWTRTASVRGWLGRAAGAWVGVGGAGLLAVGSRVGVGASVGGAGAWVGTGVCGGTGVGDGGAGWGAACVGA